MGQDRLRNLAILFIENSMARSLNFDDVIDTLAEQKARRKGILLINILNCYYIINM